jgi:hypothetical protein
VGASRMVGRSREENGDCRKQQLHGMAVGGGGARWPLGAGQLDKQEGGRSILAGWLHASSSLSAFLLLLLSLFGLNPDPSTDQFTLSTSLFPTGCSGQKTSYC